MARLTLFFALFSLCFSACKDCKQDGTGEFTFENGTSKNIYVRVDGFEDFTVFATGEKSFTFPEGRYNYLATTDDGDIWEGAFEVAECEADAIELIL